MPLDLAGPVSSDKNFASTSLGCTPASMAANTVMDAAIKDSWLLNEKNDKEKNVELCNVSHDRKLIKGFIFLQYCLYGIIIRFY